MRDEAFELLNRHVNVSRETFERLLRYHDLLLKWQSRVNLIGPATIPDIWQRHFLDSLQLWKYISASEKILDIGSGAGFPGMVLAASGATDVHLIESDGKKISFLQEVARVTETKVSIHHARAEQTKIDNVMVIVSRACSSLDDLLSLSSHFVSRETKCLFHKGKNYSTEIEEAKEHWSFDSHILPSLTDTQGVILKLTELRGIGNDDREGRKS